MLALRALLAPSFVGTALLLSAQLQPLTLKDAVLKAGTELAPERLRGLQWIEGAQRYSYVKGEQLMRGDIGKSMDRVLVELSAINAQLPDSAKLKAWLPITWSNANRFTFVHNQRFYAYDLAKAELQAVTRIEAGSGHEEIEPSTGAVAFVKDDNILVMRAGEGKNKPTPITSDGGNGIVNGQSVHRQEYGVEKGLFWAPKGGKLAFYRMDESMVSTYMLEDIGTKPSTFEPIRYPMAGQASHHVTIGVHDMNTGSTVFLKTGEPLDQYLTNISWEPDEQHLLVAHIDRATQNLRMVRYDAATGEAEGTVFTERDEKYIEPLQAARHLKTRPTQFIWRSRRDGWQHLYLYDVKKGLVRQLTQGAWEVERIVGLDPKESFAIVEGTGNIDPKNPAGALETHLYRIDLANGRTTRLTSEPGSHHGQLSSDGKYLLDTWSSLTVPNRSMIRNTRDGSAMKTLVDAKDPFAGHQVGSIELLSIEGENGDRLNARVIKPSTFQSRQRYPVLVYVYNGPHVQLVSNSFLGGASAWMLHAAERGYVVFTVDGHGTPNRGRDFEQVVHRQLGVVEVKDQMRGVAWLKEQPWVDGDRLAVHGWSYGGHMTTAMLTRHPGAFRAGAAGGPVIDWSLYEVMYGERYMDTPQENPEGYAATTLSNFAKDLKDPLLIITGGKDDTVVPEHSYQFLKACVAAGVQVEFFNYPGHGHNVRGKDRLHLMEKVLGYIDEHVRPDVR
ncbi:MAG: DPP IV N-terminal domain-containing protein [Flavobacteriales bacterium]|jgi:dipeptidyl-peptidase-4|nr:DPP IV N-terminal domain-containing protein [Flavobacteriales bacterium]